MVSPNLLRKTETGKQIELNENAKKLFRVIYSEQSRAVDDDDDSPKIRVSVLISRLAFFYEKVRNAVDYDEEHLLRKNAIARILRRQVMIEGVIKESGAHDLANHLLVELIRASYLPNNQIPEAKIGETAVLLEKYLRLKSQLLERINRRREAESKADAKALKQLAAEKTRLIRWLLDMAACEIEENLGRNKVKQAIMANMFAYLSKNVELPADLAQYKPDLEIQTYLSVARTYAKFDKDMLSFVLFKYYNSDWLEIDKKSGISAQDDAAIAGLAARIGELDEEISRQLEHPLARILDRTTRQYSLYYTIFSDTISEDPAKLYNEAQKGAKGFITSIKKVCAAKYKKAKAKLWRAAVRSIIYIFLTKSVFAVAIEVPAIQFFNEPANMMALIINITFPALLLFFIVALTRTPGEHNTERIIKGIEEIALVGEERTQPIILRGKSRRNFFVNFIFNLIYAAAFVASVYFIWRLLSFFTFTWVSIVIFLFFLAFVSFFSVVTTKGVKELMVVERKENLLTFLIDLFFLPIILAGRWLSGNISKVNIFIFLFDFIIEAPFKILVEAADDWTRYVKERRDNLDT